MRDLAKATVTGLMALTFALGSPGIAFSQEDGVTLDPGDPAAKEYALPHEEARREAGGQSKAPVRQGARDSALFGEGVTPDDEASTGTKRTSPDERQATPTPETSDPAKTSPDTEVVAPVASGGDGSGPGGTTVLLGGGAAALFAVLLGGFGLRALRGPQDA